MIRVLTAALAFCAVLAPLAHAHGGGGGGGGYVPIFIGGGSELPGADVGSYENIHKVAVLSSIGSDFTLEQNVVRDSQFAPLDISSLKLDEEISQTIKKYLGGRFEFVDMNFDGAAMNALPLGWGRDGKTKDFLKSLNNPGVDAYILVRPTKGFGSPQGMSLVLEGGRTELSVMYEIDVVDAHTLHFISQSQGRIAEKPGDRPHFPSVRTADVWIGIGTTPTAAGLDVIHKYATQLLTRSVVETIRSLQFGVTLPPTGDHSIAEPVFSNTMASIHSVAIISAIGKQIQLEHGGHMFSEKYNIDVPVNALTNDVNVAAVSTAREVLSRRYTVKAMSADTDVLSQIRLIAGMRLPALRGLTATTDVDAYVVILDATSINSDIHGLGFRYWTPALAPDQSAVFADYAIEVIDARTLKPIAGFIAAEPLTSPCPKPGPISLMVPECAFDAKYFPEKGTDLTAEAVEQMRQTFSTLLAASIPETLFHLGLSE